MPVTIYPSAVKKRTSSGTYEDVVHGVITSVDDALSSISTSPVQNKVVKAGIDAVQENLDDLGFSIDQDGTLNQTVGNSAAPLITDATGQKILNAIYQINGGYYKEDYKSIAKAVRAGNADKIPLGLTFTVPHEVYGNIDFVVRRRNVDKVHGNASKPTLTIQSKYLLSANAGSTVSTFQYDRPEAMFPALTTAIPNGTVVKFTSTAYGGWVAGTWNFTASVDLPVGTMFCLNKYQDTALGSTSVVAYASQKATSAIATMPLSSGDGSATVNLGTWATDGNHPQRISYGSNNEVESNLFQWLNGRGLMVNTWTPQTRYDMMDTSFATKFGFLEGFSGDFLDCLGLCDIHNLTNDVFESQDSDYTKSQEYTHTGYFWLPSRKEIYGSDENSRESSEAQFPYYAEMATSNADKLMYAKGATSPYHYWLRTPYAGPADYVRFCHTGIGGALDDGSAVNSVGVAPLAILA